MRSNTSFNARVCLHFFAGGFLSAVLLSSCGTGESKEEASGDSTAVATPVGDLPFDTLIAFCNWTELGLRDTAGEKKGKYITTIYLGEQFTLLGDTTSEISQGKRIHYHKVRLVDGKEGWVRDDFIAIDAVPAVFVKDAMVCLRPDASTVSDRTYKTIDVVAVRPSQAGWADVNGKPAGKNWFLQGFVQLDNLSFQKIDVALAVLYRRAIETKDPALMQTRLNNLQTPEYMKSQLYPLIFGSDEEEGAPETAMYDFSGNTAEFINRGASFTSDIDDAANAALLFNGASYLIKPLTSDIDSVSYFFWMRADKSQPGAIPFIVGNACNSGYALLLEDNGAGGMRLSVLCGGVTTNATDSDYTVPVGEWVHVGLVKAGTQFTIFIDGLTTTSGTSAYNPPSGGLTIGAAPGCNPPGYGAFFSGAIDDFFVARYAMMEAEAKTVRNGGFK